jgi:hypothetical protein
MFTYESAETSVICHTTLIVSIRHWKLYQRENGFVLPVRNKAKHRHQTRRMSS